MFGGEAAGGKLCGEKLGKSFVVKSSVKALW
jgi:hypothetical protein